jgi:hypothetical protein
MGKTRQKANLTSDNLITSNIDTDRIGINSSSPTATLDVGGNVNVSGDLISNRIGINSSSPTATLDVGGNVNVSGVVTSTGGFNIGISSSGIPITSSSIKTINFVGSGNTFSVDGNTVNVSISGGSSTEKTVIRSVATNNQTIFYVTYDVGYVDVYLNGVRLDTTEFTATNGTTIVLAEGASENDILEFVAFTGISLGGTVVVDDTTTNSTRYLTHTDAISGSIGSIKISSSELTFNPGTNTFTTGNIVGTSLNISGIGTITTLIPTQTRIQSAAEKLVRVNGNSVDINFTTSGSNIGLCTNPTGNITLNVTGIPTDSSFDNHSILFSVVVIQTGTARTCNAVTLNGVSRTIKWPSGTVGSGTTNSYDIFNFTGINTVGSASTTTNYEVLGLVNGGFR